MMKYRAVKKNGHDNWCIEEYDTEHQIASYYCWDSGYDTNKNGKVKYFATKISAESWIRNVILRMGDDEYGEWINGPI